MKTVLKSLTNYIPFYYLFIIIRKLRYDFFSWRYNYKDSIVHFYKKGTGNNLNLENPLRYTEKLQWLKINYRNPAMTLCADKYAVREYVKEKGFGNLLNDIIGIYDSPSEIKFETLPDKFVIKTSHSSGWNIICTDKKKLVRNWFWWKKILNIWIKEDYSKYYQEWNYSGIQPRILCEKFLGDSLNGLNDYKFFCFDGQIKLVQVDVGRYSGHKQNYYDEDWNYVPLTADSLEHFDINAHKPQYFEKMKKISRILSADFPYCRVDLFEWKDKIYFGEITFFDGSGYYKMEPDEFDFKIGEWLKLPDSK